MKQVQGLMQKEMSRKEFLTTLGLGVVSILGFSTIINALFGRGQNQQSNSSYGYGSSAYGGTKRS